MVLHKLSRKAQIKMVETIGILIIFFLLLVFGFNFFGNVGAGQVEKSRNKAFELKSIEVAQTILFLAELQCTEQESVDIDCIDIEKMKAFRNIAYNKTNPLFMDSARLHYFNMFGKARISLHEVYPANNSWTFYDNFNVTRTRKLTTNLPVTIFHPIGNSFSFGYLQIEVAS